MTTEIPVEVLSPTQAARPVPTKALPGRSVVIDRNDLAAMTEIVRDLGDAADSVRVRELTAELSSFLEYWRLELQ